LKNGGGSVETRRAETDRAPPDGLLDGVTRLGDLPVDGLGGPASQADGMRVGVIGDLVPPFGQATEEGGFLGDFAIAPDDEERRRRLRLAEQIEEPGRAETIDGILVHVRRRLGQTVDSLHSPQAVQVHVNQHGRTF
jgi:hypothetical protein